ncbi:TetR/AcrR family transcriptional regulator [Sphingobacterium siyangense]|uniref:TetR/AcrR family transcriptional regulator n=1 Tax=Sphingobacterium siyangense TaxID=459529 RepID=UPI00289D0A36|nr:TetR/AcrR family transcriptional regulator [Sphingobacterium siyangense]
MKNRNSQRDTSKKPKKGRKLKQTRNKNLTMELFREAAKRIVSHKGVSALRINSLQKEAGKSKSLIYSYFGGISGVLREVLETNDVWLSYYSKLREILSKRYDDHGKDLVITMLKQHLHKFSDDKLAQEVSLLELTSKDDTVLKELSESREFLGDRIFHISEEYFSKGTVSIRMVLALLIGGINYMVLHANSNGSTLCGLNIHTSSDFDLMGKTLEQIISWAYEKSA